MTQDTEPPYSTRDRSLSLLQEIQSDAGPVTQLELKSESEDELITNLLEAGDWNEEDRSLVQGAYELAKQLHDEDIYKGKPYIYHSLRIANRIVRYMGIRDPKVIAAALVHDVVEDHAPELVKDETVSDPAQLQRLALGILGSKFGGGVAEIVSAVTNTPDQPGEELTYEQWLERYAAKVGTATSTFEGWAVKFSDWCENGLGIIHSELLSEDERVMHFKRKYGGQVLDIFVARYKQYRDQLNPEASNYVATQLTLAFQRLILELPHNHGE